MYNILATEIKVKDDPCYPSPCGYNAECLNGICTCALEYHGDPYTGCRPECVLNSDCVKEKACINNKCINPCPGSCAVNAICDVINHIPICTCPPGMTGSAFIYCTPLQGMDNVECTIFIYFNSMSLCIYFINSI